MAQCGIQENPDMVKATLLRCLPAELRLHLSGFQDQTPQQQSTGHRVNAIQRTAGVPPKSPQRQESKPTSTLEPFHPGQRPVICRGHLYYGARTRTCRRWCQFPRNSNGPQPRILGPTERTPAQSRASSPERQVN
jgi:hypothetical protein